MRVAVASGKGGTGKTTLAVSLALSLAGDRGLGSGSGGDGRPPPLLLDCDVEAPDTDLFLHPEADRVVAATVPVPEIDPDLCTLCGDCVEVCAFQALAILGGEVRLFPEMCHGCGSCGLICPVEAITEVPRQVGRLEMGWGGGVRFARGVLDVGESMPVPVIRSLKAWARPEPGQVTILDAPPGTSCPMVETVTGSDFVILVTEPTPFGVHDLELAVEVVRELELPAGVVVNRAGAANAALEAFCARERLPILLRIPFERAIAEGIARGATLLDVHPEYGALLRRMLTTIREAVAGGSGSNGAGSPAASPGRVVHQSAGGDRERRAP